MVLKPDQEHIKELLTETITLLCCNGLHFKSEFSIDALIGITLDQENVLLISIKETFQNNQGKKKQVQNEKHNGCAGSCVSSTASRSLAINNISQVENELLEVDVDVLEDDCIRGKYNHQNMNSHGGKMKQLKNKRKHRTPSKLCLSRNDLGNCTEPDNQFTSGYAKQLHLDSNMSSIAVVTETKSLARENSISIHDMNHLEDTFAKSEDLKDNGDTLKLVEFSHQRSFQQDLEILCNGYESDAELVFIKQEPVEKSLLPVRKAAKSTSSRPLADGEFNSYFQKRFSSAQSVFFEVEDSAGCSTWNQPESSSTLHMPLSKRHRWQLEPPLEFQVPQKEVDVLCDDITYLSSEELAIARAILSMRGNFVSLGCLKANRQSLRNYTREHLIGVMEKISSPPDHRLFIGLLYTFGTTRVFFKCPPSEVSSAALSYFGFDPLAYTDSYNEPVIIDKNIRDPVAWIEKILDKSPFK